jgi:methionyl-tRNA formyltransferase
MKIIYMGTPAFACKPLEALQQSRHEVVAVVTGADKRRGRGGETCRTEVCCTADDLGLRVFTPKSLKSDQLFEELAALSPDLTVVIAFRLLPQRLCEQPRFGAINVHASLLPRYRGAAPINWALINGEKETGLTSFFLTQQIDAGSIILQRKLGIADDDNFDSLYARLSEMSGQFLLDTLDLIESGEATLLSQDERLATPAPKILPDDAMIDFGFPAENIRNFVRGLSTRPGAYTFFRGKKTKILRCRPAEVAADPHSRPGSIIPDKKRLLVRCADSAVEVETLVPEGRKQMAGMAFLNGFRPKPDEIFGDTTTLSRERF